MKQDKHPLVLDMFEQITNASKGNQILMFLDYNGTLSQIELSWIKSRGTDIKGPSKGSKNEKDTHVVLFQPAGEFLPTIDEVYQALLETTKSTLGAKDGE
ncbi:unnamed protein product [Ilex paraguariensis]|uniref:Uncharacterized protein n=1 Tax=Ilex paraguariensis TaxID=185542 RepID=A0ABC8UFW5_9AQUA